jgi:hypothetical protein
MRNRVRNVVLSPIELPLLCDHNNTVIWLNSWRTSFNQRQTFYNLACQLSRVPFVTSPCGNASRIWQQVQISVTVSPLESMKRHSSFFPPPLCYDSIHVCLSLSSRICLRDAPIPSPSDDRSGPIIRGRRGG